MYYGDKRKSKVNICHTLQDLGWTIFGYKEDKSDSMTDYYDPANWDGIATKNGYTLCIDIDTYNLRDLGREIFQYTKPDINFKTNAKIKQLNVLANDRAATDGEKQSALEMIEKLTNKIKQSYNDAEESKELICTYPTFQANPPSCNWHIEKDGLIIAKGKGAFQFHNLPYRVDAMTGKQKELKKFQDFINKVENVASIKIGEGEEESYERVIVTEYKKENKVKVIENGEIKEGANFILNVGFNYGCYKGLVYHIKSISNNYIEAYKYNGKLTKLCYGRASQNNRFNISIERLQEFINKNSISLVDIVEVNTPYEVEKCVKKKSANLVKTTVSAESNNNYTYDIKEDVDTRDNSLIYVVKVVEKLDKEAYINVNNFMKSMGGYYSKFKHGFIFKENPCEILNADLSKEEIIQKN